MRLQRGIAVVALGLAAGLPALGGITVYEDDDSPRKIEIGGRIQAMYSGVDPSCGSGIMCLENDGGDEFDSYLDRWLFRRLRPYIAGTVTEHWLGKIEVDFGESLESDEVQIKDAYFVYSGFENEDSRLYVGNSKSVFGREFLNSSASLVRVERGFAGDHNFGVPDRALGVGFESRVRDGKLSYQLNAGAQHHDPAINRMDFDSPVNNQGDWNEGLLVAGRVDVHPLGHMKFSQGDFDRGGSKVTIGIGAFTWTNDDDNNSYTMAPTTKVDLDQAHGYELSAAYRGHGVTVDAEFQVVSGDTVVEGFTGGLYRNGTTDLEKISLVGSYMVVPSRLEVVAGFEQQDADNYEDEFTRTSGGLNWYINRNDLKLQVQYQAVESFIGLAGQDQNVWLVSTQFAF